MKKSIKILSLVLAMMIMFLLGWRVMPMLWPDIKQNVVYRVFPQLRPETVPTVLYHPQSTGYFDDDVQNGDSLVYYFYKDTCPWCRELAPLMGGLPKQITLPDGTVSAVKLICLNKVEEPMLQVITKYYEQHEVPEDRQFVPAVMVGDRYLYAKEEISGQLMDALVSGEGLDTPLLNGRQRVNGDNKNIE